jgi:electron transfer flavoprotein alpha subunit
MSGVLVIAETRRGELREVSLELVSAARGVAGEMGDAVSVAVIGADADSFAGALAADGVSEVLTVSAQDGFEAEVWAAALEALIESEQPALVLCGHTIDSMGFAPAVAARKRLGFASDVVDVRFTDGELRARRGAYGDKLVAELAFGGRDCTLLTVRAGIFPAAAAGSGSAAARAVQAAIDGVARTEHVSFREAAGGDVDIT